MKFTILAAGVAASLAASPAQAQLFLKAPAFAASPVTGSEPGIGLPLPGATQQELRAALVWNLRAGLNVAALQCQFEPTLLTLNHYNYLISDHSAEFADAYKTLGGYFKRTTKTPKEAQGAIDQYGTRTYSGFSTVQGQLGFCQTASSVGREALFAPRGGIDNVASRRLRELRNSLSWGGEQQFTQLRVTNYYQPKVLPVLPSCWDGKNNLRARCYGLVS